MREAAPTKLYGRHHNRHTLGSQTSRLRTDLIGQPNARQHHMDLLVHPDGRRSSQRLADMVYPSRSPLPPRLSVFALSQAAPVLMRLHHLFTHLEGTA